MHPPHNKYKMMTADHIMCLPETGYMKSRRSISMWMCTDLYLRHLCFHGLNRSQQEYSARHWPSCTHLPCPLLCRQNSHGRSGMKRFSSSPYQESVPSNLTASTTGCPARSVTLLNSLGSPFSYSFRHFFFFSKPSICLHFATATRIEGRQPC